MFLTLNRPVTWNRLLQPLLTEMESLSSGFPGRFPALNVWETDAAYHLEAELPGVRSEDLELTVEENELLLKGERKAPEVEGSAVRRERNLGHFERRLALPLPVAADAVVARLEDGILTVTLPKHESTRPRRIPVNG